MEKGGTGGGPWFSQFQSSQEKQLKYPFYFTLGKKKGGGRAPGEEPLGARGPSQPGEGGRAEGGRLPCSHLLSLPCLLLGSSSTRCPLPAARGVGTVHETIAGTWAPLQHPVGTLLVWGSPKRSLLGAATAWGPCLGTQRPPTSPKDVPNVLGTVAPGSPAVPPPCTAGSSRILQPPAGLYSPCIHPHASPALYRTGKTQYQIKTPWAATPALAPGGMRCSPEVRAVGSGCPAGLRASPSGDISCAGWRPGP